jgi:hypothetical protein
MLLLDLDFAVQERVGEREADRVRFGARGQVAGEAGRVFG